MEIEKTENIIFNRKIGIISLGIASSISWIIAMSPKLNDAELGALFNLFLPPMIGIISILIYLLVFWIHKMYGFITLIILIGFNLLIGISLLYQNI